MSLKAYNACKMTLNAYEQYFLPAVREHAFKKAKEICDRSLSLVQPDAIEQEGRKVYAGYDWKMPFEEFFTEHRQLVYKLRIVLERMRLASLSPYAGEPECIDASFNMWIKDGMIYTMRYGDVLRDFKLPYGVDDYSYWNNCDGPSDVLESEWQRRGKLWDLISDEWDAGRLLHEVINVSNNIGVYQVARNYVDGDAAWSVLPKKK